MNYFCCMAEIESSVERLNKITSGAVSILSELLYTNESEVAWRGTKVAIKKAMDNLNEKIKELDECYAELNKSEEDATA